MDYFGGDSIIELRRDGNPNFARGAFGEISVAIRKSESEDGGDWIKLSLVAVKTIINATEKSSQWGKVSRNNDEVQKLSEEVKNELQSLRLLNPHPNIIQLEALFQPKGDPILSSSGASLALAFEYCPIDLYLVSEWRRRSLKPLLSFEVIRAITKDLLVGLAHCHRNHIIHRDIKPGNILVSSSGYVKICDFGLSKTYVDARQSSSIQVNGILSTQSALSPSGECKAPITRGLCTLNYRPPEVLLGGRSDHPNVDVYSAGVVISELVLGGRTLFPGINDLDQLGKIFSFLGTPSDTHWPTAKNLPHGSLNFVRNEPKPIHNFIPRVRESQHFEDFLQGLLSLDPAGRRSCDQLLQHPWMTQLSPFIDRTALREDLVDISLHEPWLLSHENDFKFNVSSKQALDVAFVRRGFAKSLSCWSGAVEDERPSNSIG